MIMHVGVSWVLGRLPLPVALLLQLWIWCVHDLLLNALDRKSVV